MCVGWQTKKAPRAHAKRGCPHIAPIIATARRLLRARTRGGVTHHKSDHTGRLNYQHTVGVRLAYCEQALDQIQGRQRSSKWHQAGGGKAGFYRQRWWHGGIRRGGLWRRCLVPALQRLLVTL
jgi:hypothetical protein